ncbi:MAG: HAMP domain-containing sensor histidine kinase [Sphingomonadales bacterium]
MTAQTAPEHARTDGADKLVSASERLGALNTRAGGQVGAVLAVPQLATLARLARTLRIPVSRTVFAADGDDDVELYVQAKPAEDGVSLSVAGWTSRVPRKSWLVAQPAPPATDMPVEEWTWATDARLVLTEVSFAPSDASELRPLDLIGRPLTRLVRLVEDEEGDLPILASLAEKSGFTGQRAVRRDIPDSEFILSGSPRLSETDAFLGFSGTATYLPRTPDVAPEDFVADSDFAQRLGVALRGPLDRIVSRADTIGAQADGPLRRDYADYAGDIASAGRHLLALVDDLADLDAVEQPGFTVAPELVDLADAARRAAGLLAVRAADSTVRIDGPALDEELMAQGDFHRVLQILVNLLTNAIRYSPPGAMVWLRTESDDSNAVVIIADQGRGIAADDHERVFQKFARVDPSEPGGSGLGLYISRRLARAMGGDITLDSAPGQGARFALTLPISA